MVRPISVESKRIMVTALAPMAAALRTMRSRAWRRASSLSLTYDPISPPTRPLRAAVMLPPRLRDRTVRPNTWPIVLTTRVPGMFSVVVTIMGRDLMFSVDACIALPPVPCDLGRSRVYQCDITLIDTCQSAPERLADDPGLGGGLTAHHAVHQFAQFGDADPDLVASVEGEGQ